jgi:CDP-6-deoxy-D-xylo-4-hexulose-3-dehydrase
VPFSSRFNKIVHESVISPTLTAEELRSRILELARLYFEARQKPPFIAGKTYIPVTGKLLDAADLCQLLDASMDLWLTTGRFCEQFERKLADRFGTKFARLTCSGSAANLLAFSAFTSWKLDDRRIAPGSEVITAAAGFPTTVAPIVQNRCVPVFVDVEIPTYDADPSRIADAIGPKTRAIMLAHTLGNPFDAEAVAELAREHDLYLIEDCCDAFGARVKGRPVGTFGHAATLSFYPAHHITLGEGGAVLANQQWIVKLVESFRDWGRDCWCATGAENTCGKRFDWDLGELPHGYDHKYIYSHLGYNLKATDMQAAIGVTQLDKLDTFIARRRENFDALRAALELERIDEHFELPEAIPGAEPSWFGFPLTIRSGSPLERRQVVTYLEEHRIGTRLLFAGNLTRQPAFKGIEYRVAGTLDNSDRIMRDSFWVGVWPGIGADERAYMVDTFKTMVRTLA